MNNIERFILSPCLSSRHHLEYKLNDGADAELVKSKLGTVRALLKDQKKWLIAVSKSLAGLLDSKYSELNLVDFEEINSAKGHKAIANQGDIMIVIQDTDRSTAMDLSLKTHKILRDLGELIIDINGFSYHGSDDLIGFEDGTGNPKTDEKMLAAAVIPKNEVGAGGTIILTQKWVHKLDVFNAMPVHSQEKIVGRTKVENIELEGDAMPKDSHVSRTDLTVDDVPQKVMRRSSPYGNMRENGLYFLSMACDQSRHLNQLNSMYGKTKDGIIDRILDYSDAVSSSFYFALPEEELINFGS